MSEAAAVAAAPEAKKDHTFLLRKLHSLSGIVPIGAYMAFHLFENMHAAKSPESFDTMVKGIWSLAPRPVFYLIELCAIFIPLLFHSFYGFAISRSGQPNIGAYQYRRNYLYTLQRVTGVVVFLYLAYHVWTLRFVSGYFKADTELSTFAEVREKMSPAWVTFIYLLGNLAAAFHLGNGLWGFATSWGLAVGRKSQRLVELLGWGVTFALSAMSIYIVVAFHMNQ